jgi:hypothetical protein
VTLSQGIDCLSKIVCDQLMETYSQGENLLSFF